MADNDLALLARSCSGVIRANRPRISGFSSFVVIVIKPSNLVGWSVGCGCKFTKRGAATRVSDGRNAGLIPQSISNLGLLNYYPVIH